MKVKDVRQFSGTLTGNNQKAIIGMSFSGKGGK